MKDSQVRIIVYFSIILLVVSGGIGLVSYMTASTALMEDIEEAITIRVEDGAKLVTSRLETYLHSLEAVARRNILRMDASWEVKSNSLRTETENLNYIHYKDIGIATLDGKYRTINDQTADISDRDYFKKASKGIPTISDPIASRIDNEVTIAVAVPIYGPNNSSEVIGVLVGTIKGKEINSIVQDMRFGKTGYSFIVNKEGTIIAHPNGDIVFDMINIMEKPHQSSSSQQLKEISMKMTSGQKGTGQYTSKGITNYVGYAPIEGTSWSIGIVASKHELHQRLYNLGVVIGRATFLLLITGLLVSILIERRLIKSIDFIKERLFRKNTKILILKCKERTGLIGDIGSICGNHRVSINDLVISRECDIEENKDCQIPVKVYLAISVSNDFAEEAFFKDLKNIKGIEELVWKNSQEVVA